MNILKPCEHGTRKSVELSTKGRPLPARPRSTAQSPRTAVYERPSGLQPSFVCS